MKDPIIVPNGDSTIWDRDRVVADLVTSMIQQQPFEISLNSEGPCAETLGLYSLLDSLCERYQYRREMITIHTCNQLEKHDRYVIRKMPPIKGISDLQKNQSDIADKKITSDTKHFSNFVSRGNRMRLVIASELYSNHPTKTLQSYHTDVKNGYFSHHIGLEEVMFHDYEPDTVDLCYRFLKKTPIKLDNIKSYPILHDDKVYDIMSLYQQAFVDITNLAYFSGNTFYVDEKIWRPVLTKTPFIVQGPRNFLENLKRLGFQTFSKWWDEGYSEDPLDYQVRLIIENIQMISSWNTKTMSAVYADMKSTLDHNYEVFMSLDQSVFKKAFDYV
jgi:hypothetical protein